MSTPSTPFASGRPWRPRNVTSRSRADSRSAAHPAASVVPRRIARAEQQLHVAARAVGVDARDRAARRRIVSSGGSVVDALVGRPARTAGGRRSRWAAARGSGGSPGRPDRREARDRVADARERRGEGARRTGAAGWSKSLSAGPSSTILPAYITSTRSQVVPSTDRSWLISSRPRPSSLHQVGEHVEHLRLHHHVERGRRLVGDDQLRPAGQRHARSSPAASGRRTAGAGTPWRALAGSPTCSSSSPTRAAACALLTDGSCSTDRLGDLVADLLHRVERVQGALEDHRRLGPAQRAQLTPAHASGRRCR